MRKAAPLIILSESNLVEEPVAIDTKKHEAKQKGWLLVHQEAFLSKQHL